MNRFILPLVVVVALIDAEQEAGLEDGLFAHLAGPGRLDGGLELLLALVAEEQVAVGPARDHVIALAPGEKVGAAAARDRVVAFIAIGFVGTTGARDAVIALVSEQRIVLAAAIEQRAGRPGRRDAVYLLAAGDGRRIAGNLAAWPPTVTARATRSRCWSRVSMCPMASR